MSENRINNPKGKLGQLLCRHKHTNWYQPQTKFFHLQGETHHLVCEDCGKVLDKRFVRYSED